jgi:hypothetical protein
MAKVEISSEGGVTQIKVDGTPVRCVTGASVAISPLSFPEVTLNLAPHESGIDLSDACLKIGGIEAPEALERAILAHLSEKYPPKVNISVNVGRTLASREIADAMQRMRCEILKASHAGRVHDMSGGPVSPHYVPGPTPNEMLGSVSVTPTGGIAVSSLALAGCDEFQGREVTVDVTSLDDSARRLVKLPVREMTDTKPAPAGLTRLATDGERNGRMAWVPGA